MKLARTASSYDASAASGTGASSAVCDTAANAASAARRPDSTA